MSHEKKGLQIFKALALFSQLGLTIGLPILTGILLGRSLDERYQRRGTFTILFMILGVIAGFTGAYRLMKGSIPKRDGKK